MKKLHVLHVVAKLNAFGGTPAKLFYQMTAPSEHVQYSICCLERGGALAPVYRDAGLDITVFDYSSNSDPRQIFDIMKLIRSKSIDVVNTHFARSNTYGRLAALLTGTPAITSEHGIFRHTSPMLNFFDNMFNLATRFNVSNSHATLESVKKTVRFNRANMRVIHNGVPDDFEGPPWREQSSLRQEAKLSPDDFVILDVGSHIPLRKHEVLLEAMKIVRESIPNAKVLFIGGGPTHDFLQSEAKRLGLNDCAVFWERIPRAEVHHFFPVADIFVNPTLEEGFGIATVEAMLCERPVICSRSGALVELMQEGRDGLFFTPLDHKDLAKKILQLYTAPERARELGMNARKHALEAFSVERFVVDFEKLYYEAAGRSYPA